MQEKGEEYSVSHSSPVKQRLSVIGRKMAPTGCSYKVKKGLLWCKKNPPPCCNSSVKKGLLMLRTELNIQKTELNICATSSADRRIRRTELNKQTAEPNNSAARWMRGTELNIKTAKLNNCAARWMRMPELNIDAVPVIHTPLDSPQLYLGLLRGTLFFRLIKVN